MKRFLSVCAIVLIPATAFAQTAAKQSGALATAPGQELTVGTNAYNYVEPGDLKISIHGPKFVGEYTGTFLIDQRSHWFARVNAKANLGITSYDGWCAPWLITPNSSSPNGYALDVGDYSPC